MLWEVPPNPVLGAQTRPLQAVASPNGCFSNNLFEKLGFAREN